MFLEAQFGAEALTPIEIPKLLTTTVPLNTSSIKESQSDSDSEDVEPEANVQELQNTEIERLHKMGIPVPGIEIKVDKMIARVWLEDLEVDCANRVFGDRVRAVVDRAVEVVAPLFRHV